MEKPRNGDVAEQALDVIFQTYPDPPVAIGYRAGWQCTSPIPDIYRI